ncbi:hypothetical protein DCC82_17270, partial [Geobacillus sp. LYN3]
LNLPMAKATGFLCTIELLPYLHMDTDSSSTRLSWANTLLMLSALCARFKTLFVIQIPILLNNLFPLFLNRSISLS